MNASQIANRAAQIVVGDRAHTHGDKRDNFRAIARLWNAYLGDRCVGLSSEDVALMMMLLKVARSQTGAAAEPDHYVDMCGYAAIAGELVTAI